MDEKKPIDGEPINLAVDGEELKQMIKEVVMKMGPSVPKEEKQAQARILLKVCEGLSPKDVLNISNKDMLEIYSFAHSQFSAGKYQEAAELFKMLMMLDPKQTAFITSLGVCYHKQKDYKKALDVYMLNMLVEPGDPVPPFYAYDCFKNINEPVSAGMMLCRLIKNAADIPRYAKLKQRAELLLVGIEKEIAKLRKK